MILFLFKYYLLKINYLINNILDETVIFKSASKKKEIY